MTAQKTTVERYVNGFVTGDLSAILSCLTEDVVWVLHGTRTLVGREAFAGEADHRGGPTPEIHVDRLIEEDDAVVAVGHGSVDMGSGEPADFVFSEVFTFVDGLVSRLDTFHVWLGQVPVG